MKYLVLLAGYGPQPDWADMTPEQRQESMGRHEQFDKACADHDGVTLLAGEALGDGGSATTVRTTAAGEVVITDGPYAEATEQLGGFYLIDVPDLDVLLELCRVLPPYDLELRPAIDVVG